MRITGRQLRQIINEEVENMMREADNIPKFGSVAQDKSARQSQIINAAAPKSASDLVAKVRESISAGTGGLGLVNSVKSLFIPGSTPVLSNVNFGIAVYDGNVKKVAIRGPLYVNTYASSGKADIVVQISPKELFFDGQPADESSLKVAQTGYDSYRSRTQLPFTMTGNYDSKSFNGVVRATVSAANGVVSVVIDGITAS